tara:strand:- start:15325 stop:15528 length:204 start_codon:yes stop_codon:yes gene_type:complete
LNRKKEQEDEIMEAWSDVEFEICDDVDLLVRTGWDSNVVKKRIMRKIIQRDKLIEEFSILVKRDKYA